MIGQWRSESDQLGYWGWPRSLVVLLENLDDPWVVHFDLMVVRSTQRVVRNCLRPEVARSYHLEARSCLGDRPIVEQSR